MYTHCTSVQNTQAMRRERSSDSVAKRNDVVRLMSLMDKNYIPPIRPDIGKRT